MVARAQVTEVLVAYPQIYLACHVRHPRRRNTETGVTSREIDVLSHLAGGGIGLSALARHLGISLPTCSKLVDELVQRGLATRARQSNDRRRLITKLTTAGMRVVERDSVLDAARVAAMLERLEPDERARACAGLTLLADAARRLAASAPSRAQRKDEP